MGEQLCLQLEQLLEPVAELGAQELGHALLTLELVQLRMQPPPLTVDGRLEGNLPWRRGGSTSGVVVQTGQREGVPPQRRRHCANLPHWPARRLWLRNEADGRIARHAHRTGGQWR